MYCECDELVRCRASPQTMAEMLMDLSVAIRIPKTQILEVDLHDTDSGIFLARMKMALDFSARVRRDPAFLIRAVVESWDHTRILRELH